MLDLSMAQWMGAILSETSIQLGDKGLGLLGGVLGCGLVVIGGGLGIGKVAGSACEAIARQPEAGGRIFTVMIIGASMIEGATLFSILACFLAVWSGAFGG